MEGYIMKSYADLNQLPHISQQERELIQTDLAYHLAAAYQIAARGYSKKIFSNIIVVNDNYQRFLQECWSCPDIVHQEAKTQYALQIIHNSKNYDDFVNYCHKVNLIVSSGHDNRGNWVCAYTTENKLIYNSKENIVYSVPNSRPLVSFHSAKPKLQASKIQNTVSQTMPSQLAPEKFHTEFSQSRKRRESPSIDTQPPKKYKKSTTAQIATSLPSVSNDSFVKQMPINTNTSTVSDQTMKVLQNNNASTLWATVEQAVSFSRMTKNYSELSSLYIYLQKVLGVGLSSSNNHSAVHSQPANDMAYGFFCVTNTAAPSNAMNNYAGPCQLSCCSQSVNNNAAYAAGSGNYFSQTNSAHSPNVSIEPQSSGQSSYEYTSLNSSPRAMSVIPNYPPRQFDHSNQQYRQDYDGSEPAAQTVQYYSQ
jgi:hypothetical protein